MRLGLAVLTALTVAATPALAQPRALTIDDLYDPQKRIDFSGGAPSGLVWMSDTHYLWPRPAGGGVEWVTVEAASGTATPLFEAKTVSDRVAEAVGVDSAVIGRALASPGLEMMLMPQNNPEGYDRTSVIKAAKDLHGDLLLLHGVIDDNVHLQNTMAFSYELQMAGKPFRLMLYEKSRHGVADPLLVKHMRQTMLDFTLETLLKPRPAAATTDSGQERR